MVLTILLAAQHKRAQPALNPADEGWHSLYLPRRDGRLSRPRCLITRRLVIEPMTARSASPTTYRCTTETLWSGDPTNTGKALSNNRIMIEQDLQLIRQHTERQPNTPISVCFSAGVSWKPGSIQLFYIRLSERPGSQNLSSQAMTERVCSSFKESRSRFNVLTPCFCMIPSQSTDWTTSHSACFILVFNPWDLYYQGYKIIIITSMNSVTIWLTATTAADADIQYRYKESRRIKSTGQIKMKTFIFFLILEVFR